ncbi:hypothetical protein IFM89_025734 [Coptis chinensis]|uniref:arginine--tRNA ligase n=1 Tax=Coptis chinensis TaxID=261450 RepID=A0A835I5Q4_9MAGN|nr:hypothetical protein IFM89_025734 [Coptis chinensis]
MTQSLLPFQRVKTGGDGRNSHGCLRQPQQVEDIRLVPLKTTLFRTQIQCNQSLRNEGISYAEVVRNGSPSSQIRNKDQRWATLSREQSEADLRRNRSPVANDVPIENISGGGQTQNCWSTVGNVEPHDSNTLRERIGRNLNCGVKEAEGCRTDRPTSVGTNTQHGNIGSTGSRYEVLGRQDCQHGQESPEVVQLRTPNLFPRLQRIRERHRTQHQAPQDQESTEVGQLRTPILFPRMQMMTERHRTQHQAPQDQNFSLVNPQPVGQQNMTGGGSVVDLNNVSARYQFNPAHNHIFPARPTDAQDSHILGPYASNRAQSSLSNSVPESSFVGPHDAGLNISNIPPGLHDVGLNNINRLPIYHFNQCNRSLQTGNGRQNESMESRDGLGAILTFNTHPAPAPLINGNDSSSQSSGSSTHEHRSSSGVVNENSNSRTTTTREDFLNSTEETTNRTDDDGITVGDEAATVPMDQTVENSPLGAWTQTLAGDFSEAYIGGSSCTSLSERCPNPQSPGRNVLNMRRSMGVVALLQSDIITQHNTSKDSNLPDLTWHPASPTGEVGGERVCQELAIAEHGLESLLEIEPINVSEGVGTIELASASWLESHREELARLAGLSFQGCWEDALNILSDIMGSQRSRNTPPNNGNDLILSEGREEISSVIFPNCNRKLAKEVMRGLGDMDKRTLVKGFIRQFVASIVTLQETKLEVIDNNVIQDIWGGNNLGWVATLALDTRGGGNTAVYLLYAHARICSIIRKSGKVVEDLKETGTIVLAHPAERALGLHLLQFAEIVEEACSNLLPNVLCEYLYNLSENFTTFYTNCQVVGSLEETSRLLLCEATAV